MTISPVGVAVPVTPPLRRTSARTRNRLDELPIQGGTVSPKKRLKKTTPVLPIYGAVRVPPTPPNSHNGDSGMAGTTPLTKVAQTNGISNNYMAACNSSPLIQQWMDDIANVNIALTICGGDTMNSSIQHSVAPTSTLLLDNAVSDSTGNAVESTESNEWSTSNNSLLVNNVHSNSEFRVSIPRMLARVLNQKLGIDANRIVVNEESINSLPELFLSVSVTGREEPIQEAIDGGMTPRKAFLRSAPHISRVASKLQECLRQIFGMRDIVVQID